MPVNQSGAKITARPLAGYLFASALSKPGFLEDQRSIPRQPQRYSQKISLLVCERKRAGSLKSWTVSSTVQSREHCRGSPHPGSRPGSGFSLQRTSGESQGFRMLGKRDSFLPPNPVIVKNMWSACYLKFFLTVFVFFLCSGTQCVSLISSYL